MAEYLKVLVPGHEGKDIPVLINGRKKTKRKVGQVLTLSRGTVLVSVDLKGAVPKEEILTGTTPDDPRVVTIEIEP